MAAISPPFPTHSAILSSITTFIAAWKGRHGKQAIGQGQGSQERRILHAVRRISVSALLSIAMGIVGCSDRENLSPPVFHQSDPESESRQTASSENAYSESQAIAESISATEIRSQRATLMKKAGSWTEDTKDTFETMLLSKTLEPAEMEYALKLYISHEREHSIPFLKSIVENSAWDDNIKAYGIYNICRSIVSSSGRSWGDSNAECVDFLLWAASRESGSLSRYILDDALVVGSAEWRSSNERRMFLEKAMKETPNESLRSCFHGKLDSFGAEEVQQQPVSRQRRLKTSKD